MYFLLVTLNSVMVINFILSFCATLFAAVVAMDFPSSENKTTLFLLILSMFASVLAIFMITEASILFVE